MKPKLMARGAAMAATVFLSSLLFGQAYVMAQRTDADGSYSETFNYTITRPNH